MARILVIDDEPYILKALSEMLESLGHAVTTARDGREGLAAFRGGSFDIVISDLKMPGMDGIELATRVRNISTRTGIVLITGHSTLETLVDATNRGVDAYITKPFKINQVESILDRITREQRCVRPVDDPPPLPSAGLFSRLIQRMMG